MTTASEAREAIYSRFKTLWGSTTAFLFEDDADDPPADASWVRLSVRHNRSGQQTLGAVGTRKYERGGQITIQMFTLVDSGLSAVDALIAKAQTIFEGVTFSGVRVYDAIPREIGPDGDFYQTNYDADFEYDETR